MSINVRLATHHDIPALRQLIGESVRGLSDRYYSGKQIESALEHVFGVDTQLIIDGTYFIAESDDALVGSGGWSKRKTLFGGDQSKLETDPLVDPQVDAARVRAFYIHPEWSRRGIGSKILISCEDAVRKAGFKHIELAATLPGVPFYLSRGYEQGEEIEIKMADGETLKTFLMTKHL